MSNSNNLRNFWRPDRNAFWWLLLAFPGLLFFQTVIHEGTHTLVAHHENGKFPTLAPFLHLNSSGKWRIGVTIPADNEKVAYTERAECDRKIPARTVRRLAGFIGWPQIVDLILIAVFTVIFLLWNIRNQVIAFLLRAWYFAACVDFLFNTAKIFFFTCDKFQDWAKVMIRSDINPVLFWLLTLVLWAVVLSHFYWVRKTKWANEPLAETRFRDYRWIAFGLGIMSALALLFSWLVRDPDIDKDTFAFVFGVVFQFLGLIFYELYFWWTVTQSEP